MNEEQALEAFLQKLQKPTPQEPDKSLDDAFLAMLDNEKRQNQRVAIKYPIWQGTVFRYAAAIVGLIGMFWLGRITNVPQIVETTKTVYVPKPVVQEHIVEVPSPKVAQVSEPQRINIADAIAILEQKMQSVQANQEKMMLALLQRDSPADRIEGLQYSHDMSQPAPAVLSALVKTLDTDPNVNVRRAAAEAIGPFSSHRAVREALIKSLLKQNEPSLQIAVIKLLTQVRERRAIPVLQQLAQDTETNDFVKLELEKSIELLTD